MANIYNAVDNTLISGTSKADSIENTGSNVTIDAGKGKDTIVGSTLSAEVYQVGNGDGKDIIYGFDTSDTLQITKGKLSKSVKSGDDISFKIGSTKVTLSGAANAPIQVLTADGELVVLHPERNVVSNTKKRKSIVGDGLDSITNTGDSVTISTGEGNDTVVNLGAGANIDAGADDDLIFNFGAGATLAGGAGNDTVFAGASEEVIRFGADDGYDVVYNFDEGDTLRITDGSISSSIVNGDDFYVMVDGNATINLRGAADLAVNVVDARGALVDTDTGKYIVNYSSARTIAGTDYADTIANYEAHRVVLEAGDGNDIVRNSGGREGTIDLGAGNDFLNNYSGDYETIRAGDGNDTIYNDDSYWTTIVGGAGDDSIILNTSEEVTVRAGLGDDTIINRDGAKNVYDYAAGDGNDVIYGYNSNDTFRVVEGAISDSLSSGSDVIFAIGSGTVTFKSVGDMQIQTLVDEESAQLDEIIAVKELALGDLSLDDKTPFKNLNAATTFARHRSKK